MRRTLTAVLLAAGASALAVGPATATIPNHDVGVIGKHRVIDKDTKPGCRIIQEDDGDGYWDMAGISVRAPVVFGTHDGQRVAWRFIIERSPASGAWDWQVWYRSPRQFGIADLATPAVFERMTYSFEPDGGYWYNVYIRMIWYRPNGSAEGKSLYGMEWFREGATGNVYHTPAYYDTND